MLAIVIKNTILFILIVLIFHFLLKNVLLERAKVERYVPLDPSSRVTPSATKPSESSFFRALNAACPKEAEVTVRPSEEDEMEKYVAFGGASQADNGKALDDYFKEEGLKEQACKVKPDNNQLPLTRTCDADIQKLGNDSDMKIVKECDLKQDKRDVMMLKYYADEKSMNGGSLYDGLDLSAFDALDLNYENLS